MQDEDDDREWKRWENAEEERRYWESIEDEKREEDEKSAQARADAIEAMETWFFDHFEDPQVDTPRESEEQRFIFPWGGPFEASDVLHGEFSHRFAAAICASATPALARLASWSQLRATSSLYMDPMFMNGGAASSQSSPKRQTGMPALRAMLALIPAPGKSLTVARSSDRTPPSGQPRQTHS